MPEPKRVITGEGGVPERVAPEHRPFREAFARAVQEIILVHDSIEQCGALIARDRRG